MALTEAPRACSRLAHLARLASNDLVVVAISPRMDSSRSIGESSSDGAGWLASCPASPARMSSRGWVHSSQMYPPGPAINFLTILLVLRQNEHEMRISVSDMDLSLVRVRRCRRAAA